MNTCKMCGKESDQLQNRWYVYDSGERFVASVCPACQDIHDRLTNTVVQA